MKEFWDVLSLSVDRVGQVREGEQPSPYPAWPAWLAAALGSVQHALLDAPPLPLGAHLPPRPCPPAAHQVYVSTMEAKKYPISATQW